MALFSGLWRVADRLLRSRRLLRSTGERSTADETTLGFSSSPDERLLDFMSMEELSAWENQGVPTLDRASDTPEARADERQDVTTSLNFPLHWTSARESWDYLFDFSIACE